MPVVSDDPEALTVTFIVKEYANDLASVLIKEGNFEDGVADLTLTAQETMIPVGKYLYQLTVVTSDGAVEKYPNVNECDDCSFPLFEILPSLDSTGNN